MSNPYIKTLMWFCAAVFGVVSTAFGVAHALDDKYAKAADVAKVQADLLTQNTKIETATRSLQEQIEYQADVNRKRALETELLKFDLTPDARKTQVDKAMAQNYRREIREMMDRWNRAGKPLK